MKKSVFLFRNDYLYIDISGDNVNNNNNKMSLREQAKQSLPRVLRTSFSQANAIGKNSREFIKQVIRNPRFFISHQESGIRKFNIPN